MNKDEDTFKKVISKIWSDSVWSKVISAGIIAIIAFLYTQFIGYFNSKTEVNNLILWLSILILAWSAYSFFKSFINNTIDKIRTKPTTVEIIEKTVELPTITQHSTVFFSDRLTKAFPGQRELVEWYEPRKAVDRFKILFKEPIWFKSEGRHMYDPIWWFRGNSESFIDQFKALSKTKILLGNYELEIKRVAVFTSSAYYEKSFVYVEVKGEKQTGLYGYNSDAIKNHIKELGYSSEEFGLLGEIPIKLSEYEDRAAVIKNKIVDAYSADLRVRFLSDYNFIIAAKEAPYNSKKFNREAFTYFNAILKGDETAENFFQFLKTFENHED